MAGGIDMKLKGAELSGYVEYMTLTFKPSP